jgi:hypothetical protein
VELDFLYPSEGIHRRWENNYRITATAATPDQAAFILSVPRRKPPDETQETLRTSDFPSTHVKVEIVHLIFMYFLLITLLHCLFDLFSLQEKWAKNLYIASISYGRTVS